MNVARAKRYASGFLAVLAILFIVGVSAAAAADWYVATTGNDANDCMTLLTPCLTLQAAINKASSGDTIHVAAGTYTVAGLVTVDKTLTLLGAQAGVDACGRAGAESVLSNSQGMRIAASNVVIDGFTVQDSVVAAYTGYGVWMDPSVGVTGTQVVNNIFQDNIVGVGLANAGPSQALIQHNLFQNNNKPGGAFGTGIYTDQFVGGQVTNVLIDANCFNNNENAGVGFSNTDLTKTSSNIEISNNSFDQNGRGIYFYNTNSAMVHNNRITNSTVPTDGGSSVAIAAFGDVNGLTILNNDLLTGALRGIRVGSFNVNPNSNVEAHLNNIVGFAQAGLYVDAGGHVGSVNATCNWWGSLTGPTNAGNPGGTGDTVIGDAIFTPWLLALAPGGACLGGLPCGNGVLDPNETCDPPGSPQPPNGNLCRDDCTFCGDGAVQPPETCDDANAVNGECPLDRGDQCRNDCMKVICRDPARIVFRSDPQPDQLKVQGLIEPVPDYDPSATTVGIRLENANGVLYSTALAAGDVTKKGTFLFKLVNRSAGQGGGVAYFKVVKRTGRASSISFKVYGDLSAATLAHMKVTVTIGAEQFIGEGDWKQTRTGWVLQLIEFGTAS